MFRVSVSVCLCVSVCLSVQIDEGSAQANTDRESRMFPDNKDRITCHDITRDFLIYATDVRTCSLNIDVLRYSVNMSDM